MIKEFIARLTIKGKEAFYKIKVFEHIEKVESAKKNSIHILKGK